MQFHFHVFLFKTLFPFVIPFPFLFSFNFHLKNYFHFDSNFKIVILKLIIPIAKCNSMSIPIFLKSYFPFSSNLNLNFHSNIIPLPLQFHYNFNIIFHDFFSLIFDSKIFEIFKYHISMSNFDD